MAGLSVICKLALSFNYNLFAGVAWYKKAEGEDKKVRCGKLEKGTIVHGDLEETGMSNETPKRKSVKVRLKGGEVVEGEIVS